MANNVSWTGGHSCVDTNILWVDGKGVGVLTPIASKNGKYRWNFKWFNGTEPERDTSYFYETAGEAKMEILAYMNFLALPYNVRIEQPSLQKKED